MAMTTTTTLQIGTGRDENEILIATLAQAEEIRA
jgi:hypothetical protein